jgi:uncharacterized membrane protein HdeD (DUF308 family)
VSSAFASTPSPFGRSLLRALAENWWLLFLRGAAAIMFGILTFIWPLPTILALAILWGAYVLIDGIFALWAGIAGKGSGPQQRWWLILVGVAGIAAGTVTLFYPGLTAWILLVFIACWAILSGTMQILGALALRREIEGEWFLILGGFLSVAVGAALLAFPVTGAVALVWLVAAFAVLAGCLYIPLSLRLRQLGRHLGTGSIRGSGW